MRLTEKAMEALKVETRTNAIQEQERARVYRADAAIKLKKRLARVGIIEGGQVESHPTTWNQADDVPEVLIDGLTIRKQDNHDRALIVRVSCNYGTSPKCTRGAWIPFLTLAELGQALVPPHQCGDCHETAELAQAASKTEEAASAPAALKIPTIADIDAIMKMGTSPEIHALILAVVYAAHHLAENLER